MKKYQGVYATTTATATRTNGKKAVGLDKQNNNFARASRFFVHFPAVVARLQRETAQVHVLSKTGTKDHNFPLSFSEL